MLGNAVLFITLSFSIALAAPAAEPARHSRVLFITSKDSPKSTDELVRLEEPGGEFERMRNRGWRIGPSTDSHIQVIDAERIAELVRQLHVRAYPAIVYVEGGEIVRSFTSGCTTPLDAWTFSWLMTGIDARPKPSRLELAGVPTTGHFGLRGNHWSIEGDWNPTLQAVLDHLHGPNHAHQVVRFGNIESWSYEELRSLHDYLHEQEMPALSYRPTAKHINTSTGKASGGY